MVGESVGIDVGGGWAGLRLSLQENLGTRTSCPALLVLLLLLDRLLLLGRLDPLVLLVWLLLVLHIVVSWCRTNGLLWPH